MILQAAHVFCLTLVTLTWISGITLNCLILAVYLKDWLRGKAPAFCDYILLIAAFVNNVLQCTLSMDAALDYFVASLKPPTMLCIIDIVVIFSTTYVSFWQTFCLSIYYCVQLVKFSHRFFVRLKMRLSSIVIHLSLGSIVLSFIINVPNIWILKDLDSNKNSTKRWVDSPYTPFHIMVGCCLPLLLTLVSFGLCLWTLLRHVWRLKQHSSQFQSPQQKGLIRAAGSMGFHLLLSSSFYLAFMCLQLSFYKEESWKMLGWIALLTYPTAKAMILIFGNPKLKSGLCELVMPSQGSPAE